MIRSAVLLCVLLLVGCAGDKSGIRVINASTAVYEVPSPANGAVVQPIARHEGRGSLILHGGGVFRHEIAADIIAFFSPAPRLCLNAPSLHGDLPSDRIFYSARGQRQR